MEILKLFICTSFKGCWRVPTAAVVLDYNAELAAEQLEIALKERGLPQKIMASEMEELPMDRQLVNILSDGDY